MSKKPRAMVVGAGYFGRFHALHYAKNPHVELVAVVDADAQRAAEVAEEVGAVPYTDIAELAGKVDVASLAVPTSLHFQVARRLLDMGIHLLIEKPITSVVEEAETLVQLAADKGLVLAVDHVERFSAAYEVLKKTVRHPVFIECYRISTWKPRATDVDVVLDLMIHDIDIIQGLVNSPIERVESVGAPVVNQTEDIANARLTFKNGCVANVTASRIAGKTERKIRVFERESYVVCDFGESHIVHYTKTGDPQKLGMDAINIDYQDIPRHDNLERSIDEFIRCVRTGDTPKVDGHAAVEALRVIAQVNAKLREHRRHMLSTMPQ